MQGFVIVCRIYRHLDHDIAVTFFSQSFAAIVIRQLRCSGRHLFARQCQFQFSINSVDVASSIRPLFDAIEGLFGYQRMLFASNFPVDKLMRSYGDILADMETLTIKADEHARNAFFAGNASRIYRL